MTNPDIKLFYAINGLAGKSGFWDNLAINGTKYSVTILVVLLAVYFFKRRKIFWTALLSIILARGILTEIIRYFFPRSRPFKGLVEIHFLTRGNLVFQNNDLEPSFPSGHAAMLFALAFSVYLYDKKMGAILILAAAILSFARIYVGVHYPSDILGGIVVAVISVWIAQTFIKKTNF